MATVKSPVVAAKGKTAKKEDVVSIPETASTPAKKRKRLAKVFKRPLDKTLRNVQPVREKFSMPEVEYVQLLELKQRLSDQGLPVKKSELVRAGLVLLSSLGDDELKGMLTKIQALG